MAFTDAHLKQDPYTWAQESLSDCNSGTFQGRAQSHRPFDRLWAAGGQAPFHAPQAPRWALALGTKRSPEEFFPNTPNFAHCEDGLVTSKANSWELWCHNLEDSEEGSEQKNYISKAGKITKALTIES